MVGGDSPLMGTEWVAARGSAVRSCGRTTCWCGCCRALPCSALLLPGPSCPHRVPSCVPTGPSLHPHRASCRYEAELSPVDQKLTALRSPLAQRPFFEAPSALGPVDLYEYESGDDLQPS